MEIPKLTPEMIAAVVFAREHENKLIRHQGGFWADAGWSYHQLSFGTPTVNALVKRGVMAYTASRERRGGNSSFPVEATLTPEYLELLK